MKNNKKGFTLLELLVSVLIIGILTSIALPNYNRSIEKSRATEALTNIKAANDAVYAYAAERGKCPEHFDKVLISIPGEKNNATNPTVITAKYFKYTINAATNAPIPGVGCGGVVAERLNTKILYKIWNPYKVINDSGKRTLACTATAEKAIDVCKTLGIYTETETPY